ncbi:MAG: hypothetical protein A3C07_00550 [Candidatus Sungbacteria bacterium RIFCSPHIGHO2_02_FULL_47_11]|uniref:Membrane insertase YidC/Oxa/ALB C-terminal domain-containing protein n=1 Tax=Candidatus Sungbacteria bacterium RIFCSPHIGHO2_02_FULL_47_11 TaxID=1802270 RepID=A0A1G2KK27_9BACT|nr:MAG: hypothetical protein A3C07_00550 [Candidatus Sungbacteria bacterium RIFCSPHIGHO2_02_FULL_47_11]
MNPFLFLYNEFLWRPLFNGLVWSYNVIPGNDLGVAIVVFTASLYIILLPLQGRARRAQQDLARIQPELKQIQARHKDNKEAQGKALMEFYAKHKVNPFSGCLIMLVQLPILLTLFQVFRQGFDPGMLQYLYPVVVNPGSMDPVSFGVLNLSQGNLYLGVVAAITQFFQTKLTMPIPPPVSGSSSSPDFSQIFQKQMLYLFPVLLVVWSYTLPSALILYWTAMNLFGIVRELIVNRKLRIVNADVKNP